MRRARKNRPAEARVGGMLALTVAALTFGAEVAGASQEQPPSPPVDSANEAAATPAPDLERLLSAGDAAGLAAAISSSQDWVWIDSAAQALIDPAQSGLCADSAVAKAIASRLHEATGPRRAALLGVLGRTSDREAVRAVIALFDMQLSPETRRRVFQCLIEQTGRSDLGEDAGAWRTWWGEHEWIPEAEWLRRVARWQAERSRRLLERARTSERGRADLYRELYSLTPTESRPAILIRLLGDPAVDVRRLGLELGTRAVVNATPLPPEVIGAATALLRDASPEVRASAATLLASAGINGASSDISQALAREGHPNPARAMLEAMSFTAPTRSDLEVASTWLNDDVAAPAAARLLAVGAERGGLTSARLRNLAWNKVQSDKGVSLGPAGVQLFGLLAPASRYGDLAMILRSGDGALRDSAAEALTGRASGVEALLAATRENPAFLRFLIDAVTLWTPTHAAWANVTALREVTDAQLVRLAGAMPHSEAVRAAKAEPNPARRLVLLDRFAPDRVSLRTVAPDVLRDAGAMRVSTLLELGRLEQVVSESRAFSDMDLFEGTDEALRGARVALLCLERIDEAMATGAGADDWIEAIERLAARNPEGARRLAQALQDQPSLGLTSLQASQLESVTRGLPEFEPATEEDPDSGDEGPRTPS